MIKLPSSNTFQKDVIRIEDFNESMDSTFITKTLKPYLSDLFDDLSLREVQKKNEEASISKTNFLEYVQLPAILGERLFA